MRKFLLVLIFFVALCTEVQAEPPAVTVQVPETKAWIGQRVPFFIELRAPGSFVGTASFDLPQLPRTILIKIGAPVVSSQEDDGKSIFIQRHEFALFSQKTGVLEVPGFAVRYASHTGFTGPATEVQARFPGIKVEIERPPGSDNIGFLVTTESLEIVETWNPQPGSAELGALFKRNIVQRAPQLPGMALAPAPTNSVDGITVYPGEAETMDQLERGEFLGERSETITYMLTKAGTFTLPALTYVWWNPKTLKMQSQTLPSVRFDVTPEPVSATAVGTIAARSVWVWLPAAVVLLSVGAWKWRSFVGWAGQCRQKFYPPDRLIARKMLRACRKHDAPAAGKCWIAWVHTQNTLFEPGPELRSAVLVLQRHLFGPGVAAPWQGDDLARTFTEHLAVAQRQHSWAPPSKLPELNR